MQAWAATCTRLNGVSSRSWIPEKCLRARKPAASSRSRSSSPGGRPRMKRYGWVALSQSPGSMGCGSPPPRLPSQPNMPQGAGPSRVTDPEPTMLDLTTGSPT